MALGISSTAIRLACSPACCPPMPSATMNRLEGSSVERGHLAIALGAAVVPDRPPAGNVEVVFVVLAIIPADRDDARLAA